MHSIAARVITEGLVALGLLAGDPSELVESEAYKKYFMHGTSHWLGLDVHDVGRYYVDGAARPMQPGCVLTVEPGLYFSPGDTSIPAEFRGIGVRIEDDVACTPAGFEVLTHDIPKAPDDLARWLAHART
jgi:Xaa-Pro aminopeptidase